jgi:hypothetical protein
MSFYFVLDILGPRASSFDVSISGGKEATEVFAVDATFQGIADEIFQADFFPVSRFLKLCQERARDSYVLGRHDYLSIVVFPVMAGNHRD